MIIVILKLFQQKITIIEILLITNVFIDFCIPLFKAFRIILFCTYAKMFKLHKYLILNRLGMNFFYYEIFNSAAKMQSQDYSLLM